MKNTTPGQAAAACECCGEVSKLRTSNGKKVCVVCLFVISIAKNTPKVLADILCEFAPGLLLSGGGHVDQDRMKEAATEIKRLRSQVESLIDCLREDYGCTDAEINELIGTGA